MYPVKTHKLTAIDGVALACETCGDPTAPPVILSHGGGQTRHTWSATAQALASEGWYAISYDHRGHGGSDWSADKHYDFDHFAEDMRTVASSCSQPAAVVGASLGGLSAMLCAGELDRTLFSSITLVDVTPKINTQGVNQLTDFMRSNMHDGFSSLDKAADAIARYTGRPRKTDLSGLSKNLRLRDGRYYWHWDPSFLGTDSKKGFDPERFSSAAANISVPVLLVRGQMSELVKEKELAEFLQLVPHAEHVNVARAGHMVVGDRNDIFSESVIEFLSRQRVELALS